MMIIKLLHAYKDTLAIVSKDNIITYKELYKLASKFEN